MFVCVSVPAIGREARSFIDRRYSRLFATYATCEPSREMATEWEKRLCECLTLGSVNEEIA